nr:hypothetical protein [uncultured Marvinbryantia sp.]
MTRTAKVVSLSCVRQAASMLPPMCSASVLLMVSPSPVPPRLRDCSCM